jgi:hypothetical protein
MIQFDHLGVLKSEIWFDGTSIVRTYEKEARPCSLMARGRNPIAPKFILSPSPALLHDQVDVNVAQRSTMITKVSVISSRQWQA